MSCQKAAVKEIFGTKQYLNQHDYKIYNTLILGYIPCDMEVEVLFGEKDVLLLKEVEELMAKKRVHQKSEAYAFEIFRAFDTDFKGYIDTADLLRAWKSAATRLSWEVLHESFNELAPMGNLGYETFKNICFMQ